ncbi:MAG: glycosyltransferase family 4 protein [Alphaproteobacteria bacterium]|nr:glycosyltransferase family 4 protein [Alphaproteobacteria bacterium]
MSEAFISRRSGSVMRIGYFTPFWPLGSGANGISTVLGHLSGELRRQGHEIYFICPRRPKHIDPGDDGSERLPVLFLEDDYCPSIVTRIWYRVDSLSAYYHETRRRIASAAERLVREHQIEIFEIEESFGWVEAVSARLSIPVVARLHGPWFLPHEQLSSGIFTRSDNWRIFHEGRGILRASAVSAPSMDVLNRVIRRYGPISAPTGVIKNAVPLVAEAQCWSPSTQKPGTILFIGRFDARKGGDTVIEAFNKIALQDADARLLFVGPDIGLTRPRGVTQQLPEYVNKHLSEQARERFQYLGPLPPHKISELRRTAAVTVVASRYENFPTVVLEAMSVGSPLVATPVGGTPEILSNEENALLVPPDDPSRLAAAVVRMLHEPGLSCRLGRRAREDLIANCSAEIVARETIEFYRQVIDATRTGHGAQGRTG